VVFDEGWVRQSAIRIRIDDIESGRIIAGPSGEYMPSEIADMSDQQVTQMLQAISKKEPKPKKAL